MTWKLRLLVVIVTVIASSRSYPTDRHEECAAWVEEGECINNPRYLWTHCHTSCAETTRDSDERCEGWADEGECSNNPAHVAVHCHESCGQPLSWNPYLRRRIGITNLPVSRYAL